MQPRLDCLSQDESSGDDTTHPPNRNEQKPPGPKRISGTPETFRADTFTNEVKNDKEIVT
ncbi:hypothetical protein BG000_009275, partial [Podila horticola]